MFDKNFYKRNLPHWQPGEGEFFVTFRLAGSLPSSAIERIKNEYEKVVKNSEQKSDERSLLSEKHRKSFQKYDSILDSSDSGPTWLSNPDVAEIVEEAVNFRNGKEYNLYAYCIMPNHVHMVFKCFPQKENEYPVTNMLKNLKSFTGLKANQVLGRSGAFWQSESYDRVIRDAGELEKVINYVIHNPVKVELVSDWKDWPHSYCKKEFLDKSN